MQNISFAPRAPSELFDKFLGFIDVNDVEFLRRLGFQSASRSHLSSGETISEMIFALLSEHRAHLIHDSGDELRTVTDRWERFLRSLGEPVEYYGTEMKRGKHLDLLLQEALRAGRTQHSHLLDRLVRAVRAEYAAIQAPIVTPKLIEAFPLIVWNDGVKRVE